MFSHTFYYINIVKKGDFYEVLVKTPNLLQLKSWALVFPFKKIPVLSRTKSVQSHLKVTNDEA